MKTFERGSMIKYVDDGEDFYGLIVSEVSEGAWMVVLVDMGNPYDVALVRGDELELVNNNTMFGCEILESYFYNFED